MPTKKSKISFVSTGSHIVGATAAVTIASLIGGLEGAAVGGLLNGVISDIANRVLSHRETIRVNDTIKFAFEKFINPSTEF